MNNISVSEYTLAIYQVTGYLLVSIGVMPAYVHLSKRASRPESKSKHGYIGSNLSSWQESSRLVDLPALNPIPFKGVPCIKDAARMFLNKGIVIGRVVGEQQRHVGIAQCLFSELH